MHQIYVDAGLDDFLLRMINPSLRYHLYANNVTPDRATVLGDLTEISGAVCSPITVALASFTLSGIANHVASRLAAPIAFVNGSGTGADAYGYYITDAADAILFAVARFDSAPVTKADGESWQVTPIIGDFSSLTS